MMKRRALGRTGIQVGEVGIGCEGFLEKSRETVREMLLHLGQGAVPAHPPDGGSAGGV